MMQLNNRISQLTTTTQRLDNLAREKEERFSKEKEWADKKTVLGNKIAQFSEDEKQVSYIDSLWTIFFYWHLTVRMSHCFYRGSHQQLQIQIAPIRAQLQNKETEKGRIVHMFDDREENADSNLQSFDRDYRKLQELDNEIEGYIASNQPAALIKVEKDIRVAEDRIKAKNKEISALRPELDRMQKMVDDQENQKSNLTHNIRLISAQEAIAKIEVQIERLAEKKAEIEGAETMDDDNTALQSKKSELTSEMARMEGRKSEIIEYIMGLKVSESAK